MRALSYLSGLFAAPFTSTTCGPSSLSKHCSSPSYSFVSAAWYAGWHTDDFPLSDVSWDKYTHLTYSFAYVPHPRRSQAYVSIYWIPVVVIV